MVLDMNVRTATITATVDGTIDLADHFHDCCEHGRHLTMPGDGRYVISDDFWTGRLADAAAASFASIYASDVLVARAAVIPLGFAANKIAPSKKVKYEELFDLIERQALSSEVRTSARALLESGFRESRIHEIEDDLGGSLSPARKRYRAFLDVVRQLTEKKISRGAFLDEFFDFTRTVAGKLDFGIYSYCLDRIFINPCIGLDIKEFLVQEISKYPPLVRKELVSNLLSLPGQDSGLVRYTTRHMIRSLSQKALTDLYMMISFKTSQWARKQAALQ